MEHSFLMPVVLWATGCLAEVRLELSRKAREQGAGAPGIFRVRASVQQLQVDLRNAIGVWVYINGEFYSDPTDTTYLNGLHPFARPTPTTTTTTTNY